MVKSTKNSRATVFEFLLRVKDERMGEHMGKPLPPNYFYLNRTLKKAFYFYRQPW